MKILHIIRDNDDRLARHVIEEIRRTDSSKQTLLMIQDGVYVRPTDQDMYACADDVRSRGIETDLPLVEYDQIIDMIFEHEKVITW